MITAHIYMSTFVEIANRQYIVGGQNNYQVPGK